jgi:hypothetical protein
MTPVAPSLRVGEKGSDPFYLWRSLAVKEWLEPMAYSPRFFFRQVQLTLTAGYSAFFRSQN